MTWHSQTRRNFLMAAFSATGGALGFSACQQANKQPEAAIPNISAEPVNSPTIPVSTEASTQLAMMPERPLGNTGLVLPIPTLARPDQCYPR
ncbi:MAG: twin-arginine translocation signal domain-containing protein, partial [Leptolyngbya sp. SIO1D8]|nr:twin-arginine translocation signal domain-containing protein [Leptolyngbya sp. SIO1D8]